MPDSPLSPAAKTQQLQIRGNRLNADLEKALVAGNQTLAREIVVDLIANAAALDSATPTYNLLSRPLDLVLAAGGYADSAIDIESVRLLLTVGAPVEPKFTQTMTPLLAALCSGNAEVVALVLDAGADFKRSESLNLVGGSETKSILVWAIESGQNAAALRMIEGGADVQGGPIWPRPLQAAARVGSLEIVKALVARGADINAQFPDKAKPHVHHARYFPSETALMEAAGKPNNPVVAFLLEWGANIKSRNDLGFNALHNSTESDYAGGVATPPTPHNAELLLQAGADVNAANTWGHTPLHGAIENLSVYNSSENQPRNLRILQLMLDAGANPNLSALNQKPPLHQAVGHGMVEAVVLLLRAGADRSGLGNQLKVMALEGETPAHQELARLLKDELLDADGLRSIFEKAVRDNDLNRVETLLAQGYDFRKFPDSVALHIACDEGNVEMVKRLLRAGCDPGFYSPQINATPLMVTAQHDRERYDSDDVAATPAALRSLAALVADDVAIVTALPL